MEHNFNFIVGHTPLLEIVFRYKSEERRLYAKYESFNMTGSIKDRMALHVLRQSHYQGLLKTGDKIVEATSGNTGISIAAIGRAVGHEVKIYMPDWMSEERKSIIRSFGAEIQLVSKEEGGFLGSIQMAKDYAMTHDNVFLPSQFDNPLNVDAHYKSTGPEIWDCMQVHNMTVDAFVAGVGTGGTVMGTGKYLKERDSAVSVHPLEPSNSPTLTTGHRVGKHRIQGISDEFIPSIVNLDTLDEIVQVDDGDAIIMAQKFAKNLGLGLGISSGANFLGALMAQEKLSPKAQVVTVFSDSNKKYLSTDLVKDEPVKPGFLSSDVELVQFRVLR